MNEGDIQSTVCLIWLKYTSNSYEIIYNFNIEVQLSNLVKITIILDLILFSIGFVLVYYSVDFLIDSLEEYLERFEISPIVFGFLILGMDFEESIASLFAAYEGLPHLSIGNLIGNTIIAISIGFAVPVILTQFKPEPIPKFYYILIVLAAVNLFVSSFFGSAIKIFGVIALILFLIGVIISIQYQLNYDTGSTGNKNGEEEEEEEEPINFTIQTFFIILMLSLVILGGELLVNAASNIIESTSISESFFGLIIMAFITNVEEFWLMLKAIQKGQIELGISAQLGKIFWNISLIFGVSAFIIGGYSPDAELIISGVIFLICTLILSYSLYQNQLSRGTAILFLILLSTFFLSNLILVLV